MKNPDSGKKEDNKKSRANIPLTLAVVVLVIVLFALSKPYRFDRLLGPEEGNQSTGAGEGIESYGKNEKGTPTAPYRPGKYKGYPGSGKMPPKKEKSEEVKKGKMNMKKLEGIIRKDLEKFPGKAGVIVFFPEMKGPGNKVEINPDEIFESASLVKIPIMAEVFHQIREEKITGEQEIILQDSHKAGGSGVLKNEPAGSGWKVSRLVELMISESDNTAADMLIELAGIKAVEDYAGELGMKKTTLRRKIYDFDQIDLGNDNYTTPRDMLAIFWELYGGEKIDGRDRAGMLNILKGQKRNNVIPRYLPPEASCAHKTGGLLGIVHDCGIIYPPGKSPCILILMGKEVRDDKVAEDVFAGVSRSVYGYYLKNGPEKPEI